MPVPTLEFRAVSKAFSGSVALDSVGFDVGAGEIHALVGENGAGKSTLINILAGQFPADDGEILLDGIPVTSTNPLDAMAAGIGCVHQYPPQVPSLSVTENLVLGLPFVRSRMGMISWARQRAMARTELSRVSLDVDPGTLLADLGSHERQLIALARVLAQKPRILVLDEITAPLSEREVGHVFSIVRALRDEGVSIIYVSHRMDEIFSIADLVTVLRDGQHITTRPVGELTPRSLAALVVGKDPDELFSAPDGTPIPRGDRPVISVKGLSDTLLTNVSFDVYAGEIVGLAGLAGAGRTNVLQALAGARADWSGELLLDGELYQPRHPADGLRRGVAMITEERQHDGYVDSFPLWKNITLPWLHDYKSWGFLSETAERKAAASATAQLSIRASSIDAEMSSLSGGNQQKTLLARLLSHPLRALLLDEPTHGVDIGAKEEIYRILRERAEDGLAILVVSSEIEELEGLCSRVLLLRDGVLIAELRGERVEKTQILAGLIATE